MIHWKEVTPEQALTLVGQTTLYEATVSGSTYKCPTGASFGVTSNGRHWLFGHPEQIDAAIHSLTP